MALARNGKLSESLELFEIIKSKNTKIGVKPALKLLDILLDQSKSSLLQITNQKNVPLEFGFNIYRLIIDDHRVDPQPEIWNAILSLMEQYEYPMDKLLAMWSDIKSNVNLQKSNTLGLDDDIISKLLQCFIEKEDLRRSMEMLQWIHSLKLSSSSSSSNSIESEESTFCPSKISVDLYSKILKLCIEDKDIESGKYIHSQCVCHLDSEIVQKDAVLQCLMMQIYHQSADPNDAVTVQSLWNSMKEHTENVKDIPAVGWNIVARRYAENGEYEALMFLYEEMRKNEIDTEKETYIAMVNVCSNIVNLEKGKSVHLDMVKATNKLRFGPHAKLLEDLEVGKALLNMYSKCGDLVNTNKHWNDLKKADKDRMEVLREKVINIQHWNCIINVHAIAGNTEEIMTLYEELKSDPDVNPNDITYTMIVDVLNRKGMAERAKEILRDQHSEQEDINEEQRGKTGILTSNATEV